MRSAYLVLACWLLAAAGCSSDHDAMEKRLNALRDDISHLQADNDRLTERLDGLEAKGREPSKAASVAPAEPVRPSLRVVKLSPDNNVAQANSEVLPEDRPDAPGNRPMIRVRGQRDSRTVDEPRSAMSVRAAAEDKP